MRLAGGMEVCEIVIELKYCERCGGLWLRLQGADGVYCAGCAALLEARQNPVVTPARTSRRPKGRGKRPGEQKQRDDTRSSRRIDYLEGVATSVVRA